jgi:hypothetical protein
MSEPAPYQSKLAPYREDENRRQDVLGAIAKVRLALRQLESELRGSGGTTNELKRVSAAVGELNVLETRTRNPSKMTRGGYEN